MTTTMILFLTIPMKLVRKRPPLFPSLRSELVLKLAATKVAMTVAWRVAEMAAWLEKMKVGWKEWWTVAQLAALMAVLLENK